MRFIEFDTGLQTYITQEEQELIEQISEKPVRKRDLTERQQEVARRLTEKSILIRQKQNDNIVFKLGNCKTS